MGFVVCWQQKVVEVMTAPAVEPPAPPAAKAPSHETALVPVRPPLASSTSSSGPTTSRRGTDLKDQIQMQMEKLKPLPVPPGGSKRMDSPANPSDLRSVLNKAFRDRCVMPLTACGSKREGRKPLHVDILY